MVRKVYLLFKTSIASNGSMGGSILLNPKFFFPGKRDVKEFDTYLFNIEGNLTWRTRRKKIRIDYCFGKKDVKEYGTYLFNMEQCFEQLCLED